MKIIIDRFEGDFAIVELEDGRLLNIPKILVGSAKEGDVLSINIDYEATEKRKLEVEKLMSKLFE